MLNTTRVRSRCLCIHVYNMCTHVLPVWSKGQPDLPSPRLPAPARTHRNVRTCCYLCLCGSKCVCVSTPMSSESSSSSTVSSRAQVISLLHVTNYIRNSSRTFGTSISILAYSTSVRTEDAHYTRTHARTHAQHARNDVRISSCCRRQQRRVCLFCCSSKY